MAAPEQARPLGIRSQGREQALQLIYSWEQNRCQPEVVLLTDDASGDAQVAAFAGLLFDGVRRELTAIDQVLTARLANWALNRLAVTDRAILRLGAYELIYTTDVPSRVVINEYIELAKLYGSEERASKLVNGILDRISRDHRANESTQRFTRPPAPLPTPSGGSPIIPEK